MSGFFLYLILSLYRGETPPTTEAPSAISFFVGCTQGTGKLNVIFRRTQNVAVSSAGRLEPDGVVVVLQTISNEGKPKTHRQWRLREVRPGHLEGTLSNATGPVVGEVSRTQLHIRFPMHGGVKVDQRLRLSEDGKSLGNHMIVRKFGIVVAILNETIRRCDDA